MLHCCRLTPRPAREQQTVFKLRVDGAAVVGKDIASVSQSIDTLSASSPQASAALAAASRARSMPGRQRPADGAAMRTLPARFTDIAIACRRAIAPFLVLLQQGSQIRGSFGGIGNAAKGAGLAAHAPRVWRWAAWPARPACWPAYNQGPKS